MLPTQAAVIDTPEILLQVVRPTEAQSQIATRPERNIAEFQLRQSLGRIAGMTQRLEEQLLGLGKLPLVRAGQNNRRNRGPGSVAVTSLISSILLQDPIAWCEWSEQGLAVAGFVIRQKITRQHLPDPGPMTLRRVHQFGDEHAADGTDHRAFPAAGFEGGQRQIREAR